MIGGLVRNGERDHSKGIESDGYFITDGTMQFGLELAIKVVNNYGGISLLIIEP